MYLQLQSTDAPPALIPHPIRHDDSPYTLFTHSLMASYITVIHTVTDNLCHHYTLTRCSASNHFHREMCVSRVLPSSGSDRLDVVRCPTFTLLFIA